MNRSISLLLLLATFVLPGYLIAGEVSGGSGSFADPHWYLYTDGDHAWYCQRGQTIESTTTYKDASGAPTSSHEVGGTKLTVMDAKQKENKHERTRASSFAPWVQIKTTGFEHILYQGETFLRLNNGEDVMISGVLQNTNTNTVGTPQFDASGNPLDDLVESESHYFGAQRSNNSDITAGTLSADTDYTDTSGAHHQVAWSFDFDMSGVGSWSFTFNAFQAGQSGSYSGDFDDFMGVGTSLGTFSDESYANGWASLCYGMEPGFVFTSVTTAWDLVSAHLTFPVPMEVSFSEMSEEYIMSGFIT